MKHKLYISKSSDRETVITILAMNGYTVRHGKEKDGNRTVCFVEYWSSENTRKEEK